MNINYGDLVRREYQDICNIHSAIDKKRLGESLEQVRKNKSLLEAQGISTDGIPMEETERKDHYEKDFEIRPYGFTGNYTGIGSREGDFDSFRYRREKTVLGRNETEANRKWIKSLNKDLKKKRRKKKNFE